MIFIEALEPRALFSAVPELRAGFPDPSFGSDGTLSGSGYFDPALFALQSDGRILDYETLVLGNSSSGPPIFGQGITRYNSDGSIDHSFGNSGVATIPIPDFTSLAPISLLLNAEGDIIFVGWTGDQSQLLIARFRTDGQLDSSFGSNGVLLTAVSDFSPTNALLEPDGKLVVGGSNELVRYNVDGTRDTSFGVQGVVALNSKFGPDSASAMAVQSDGKVLIGGFRAKAAGGVVARFDANGGLDTAFGRKGYVRTGGLVGSIALDSAGNILVTTGSAVRRFGPNGKLDPHFGVSGVATVSAVADGHHAASGVAVLSDGEIAVGAVSSHFFSEIFVGAPQGEQRDVLGITWLKPNGSVDPKVKKWRYTTPLAARGFIPLPPSYPLESVMA